MPDAQESKQEEGSRQPAAAAAAAPLEARPLPTAANDGDAAGKRIIGISAPPGPKRATRASTGAPIALTAKGSLYKANKDTGESPCFNQHPGVFPCVCARRPWKPSCDEACFGSPSYMEYIS